MLSTILCITIFVMLQYRTQHTKGKMGKTHGQKSNIGNLNIKLCHIFGICFCKLFGWTHFLLNIAKCFKDNPTFNSYIYPDWFGYSRMLVCPIEFLLSFETLLRVMPLPLFCFETCNCNKLVKHWQMCKEGWHETKSLLKFCWHTNVSLIWFLKNKIYVQLVILWLVGGVMCKTLYCWW